MAILLKNQTKIESFEFITHPDAEDHCSEEGYPQFVSGSYDALMRS